MSNLLTIFNHGKLTVEQELYAKEKMNIKDIIYLPQDLLEKWGNINPHEEYLNLDEFKFFIDKNSQVNDYVLIQGDFGAVYILVNYCFKKGLIPIYATTERKSTEEKTSEGIVKKSIFNFVRFRNYQKE